MRKIIFMKVKPNTYYFNLLKNNKQKLENEYGITRIGIFGSVARGEQDKNSDIDVFFDADKITLFRMGGLSYDLQQLFGRNVDVVRNHKNINPRFRKQIEKDIIYV